MKSSLYTPSGYLMVRSLFIYITSETFFLLSCIYFVCDMNEAVNHTQKPQTDRHGKTSYWCIALGYWTRRLRYNTTCHSPWITFIGLSYNTGARIQEDTNVDGICYNNVELWAIPRELNFNSNCTCICFNISYYTSRFQTMQLYEARRSSSYKKTKINVSLECMFNCLFPGQHRRQLWSIYYFIFQLLNYIVNISGR